ncbi:MAG: hypothetical protein Q9215_001644 [Flavoplaca cf. flavocitrina]
MTTNPGPKMSPLPPPPGGDLSRAGEVYTFTWIMLINLAVAIMWTVYAGKGYARHMFYLKPPQLSHAGELNAISRSLCVLGIGIGKVSVAFLIERFAGPSKWRKYLLRSISISILVSALLTVILFYAQCQPVQALWDKSLLKAGKAKCWDPVPLATAGICAAVKTSKIPITVHGQTDITWLAIELLMWEGYVASPSHMTSNSRRSTRSSSPQY